MSFKSKLGTMYIVMCRRWAFPHKAAEGHQVTCKITVGTEHKSQGCLTRSFYFYLFFFFSFLKVFLVFFSFSFFMFLVLQP